MDRYSYIRTITIENNAQMLEGIELLRSMEDHVKFALSIVLISSSPSWMGGPKAYFLACAAVCMQVEVQAYVAVLHNRQRTIRELAEARGFYDALRLEGLLR